MRRTYIRAVEQYRSMASAVWFDIDGTIVQYDRERSALLDTAFPGEVPAGTGRTFVSHLYRALDEPDKDPYVTGFKAVDREYELPISAEEAATRYRQAELDASYVPDGVVEIITTLGDHVPVGVLANGDGDAQGQKLTRHGLLDSFDHFIVSNEVGVKKPDHRIFELATSRVSADQHIYVGDDYDTDIDPAEEVGFDTVHVRNDAATSVSVAEPASLSILTSFL